MKLLAKQKYTILYALSVVVAVLTIISMYLVASNFQLSEQLEELVEQSADFSVSENVSLQLGLRVSELEERVNELEKKLGIAKDSIKYVDLNWNENAEAETLVNLEWQVVKQDFEGYWPGEVSLEEMSSSCEDTDGPNRSLYSEGGLCQTRYWYIDTSTGEEIFKVSDLKKVVGEIDSATKAAAWVNLTTSNVDRDNHGNALEPKVVYLSGEYYVWVSVTNAFGCGVDVGESKEYIYSVDKTGAVTLIASEKERKADPGEPVICVD